jgi:hypothetical protein
MHHLMTRSVLALGVAAGGVLAATSGAGGQPGQPGQTQSCSSQVQTTSSNGPISQSNSSSVSQSAVGGSGADGAPGGQASCSSTVVQHNSQSGAGNVTHLQGTGAAPLSGRLTVDRVRRQIQAIIQRLDPAATVRRPSCKRTGSASLRCNATWRSSAGGTAKVRVDFRHRGKRLVWRYDASRSGG